MTVAAEQMPARTGARWAGSLVIVLGLHAGAAWMLLARAPSPPPLVAPPMVVTIDLPPLLPELSSAVPSAAEPAVSSPPSVDPVQPPLPASSPLVPVPREPPAPEPLLAERALPEPTPPPELLTPELPLPELPLPERPLPERPSPDRSLPRRPAPVPRPRQPPQPPRLPIARAEPAAPPPPASAAAPAMSALPAVPAVSAAPARPSDAAPSWRNDLLGRLQRAKQYPVAARSLGDQGVALVSFTMDRRGRVVAVTLVRSSGAATLDDEAVAMIRRAEPLPVPPADLPGATLTLTVPVSFVLR